MSKPHAYLQTMTKTPVKFQMNRYKTVGESAPTRYPLSLQFVIYNARKTAKFNLQKSDQKKSEDYIQTTRISSDHNQNTSEVSK